MDQSKIGSFLKQLRHEKGLTQEQLAEQLNISNRSVSRWETGRTLPDLSTLVALAAFYDVDVKEMIDGERKSETMNEEMQETLVKVAAYADEDKKQQYDQMRKIIGGVLISFGIFLTVSGMMIFPSDSSWGAIFAVFGTLIGTTGVYQLIYTKKEKVLLSIGCFLFVLVSLIFVDYLGVALGNQVPRFAYAKEWSEDTIVYKAPFYQVIRHDYDTEDEYLEIQYSK